MSKVATVVELDLREVQDAVIAAAKACTGGVDPGGHNIRFTIEPAETGKKEPRLTGAIVQFGNKLSGVPELPNTK